MRGIKKYYTVLSFLLAFVNNNEISQRYYCLLLNGKLEASLAVNNAISRCVQLYIMATNRFA